MRTGRRFEGLVLADFAANVQAGHFRKHEIEEGADRVGFFFRGGKAAGAVEGSVDLKTPRWQVL